MGLQRSTPAPKPVAQQQEKYPVSVMEGEYQGRKTLRITSNKDNFKFDAFNGGANKLKQLFGTDKEGDVCLATAANWLIEQGVMTREQLLAWYEKLGSQLNCANTPQDDFV